MSSLCCFEHPEWDDEPHELTDTCKVCGKPFGFPIFDPPEVIGTYKVVQALDRGFYSAAFVVEYGLLRQLKVVKVAPKIVYSKFGKNFRDECNVHADVAKGSQHVIAIDDLTENVAVRFGDTELKCDVAILQYVDGSSLKSFLNEKEQISAATLAQLAIDLFGILRELQLRSVHHNDLHAGNLMVERLPETARRADAEDGAIRLVAIDLNSVTDESKSDPEKQRLGDLHWAVSHLNSFVDNLLRDPDSTSDRDYRLASVLQERAYLLSPKVEKQRTPTFDQCIEDIKIAVRQVCSPWTEPPRLRRFNDAYNAQTLSPWFVPYLIVDPENKWLPAVSSPGPQVIIGMRGCGKTMLIRALQLHARATLPDADSTTVVEQLKQDGYVGLYVSATRLLDTVGESDDELREPYARLFVSYALEAIRAVRHLREIDRKQVVAAYFKEIAKAVAGYVDGSEDIGDVVSEMQLEKKLLSVQVSLSRGEDVYSFAGNPANAFPDLADAICRCSPLWNNCCVLYLLDDVSTRFLEIPKIDLLMSSLLFSHPRCSFKLTTEVQTLEVILRSPGQIEKARAGRDYEVFDLGAEVNQIIRQRNRGKDFIERILEHRARYFLDHPEGVRPAHVLGDTPLESIASNIASTSKTSNGRKQVYFGISALAGVCVGDLGDAISIYELMLRKARGKAGKQAFPIDPRIQTDCYLEYCSRRMYDLNRRQTKLRDHALAFAEASNELLMQSYADHDHSGKETVRLRQYLKVYMRLTEGDTDAQFDEFRELVDAGVFVLDGGTHRTKTKDANPIKQFKLTFRKIFGLSSFIGLGERDRFELSGDAVVEWLGNPAAGKEILLRNLGKEGFDPEELFAGENDVDMDEDEEHPVGKPEARDWSQLGLFDHAYVKSDASVEEDDAPERNLALEKSPKCESVELHDLQACDIHTLVLGLGFEERTVASADRLLSAMKPRKVVLVSYTEEGQSREIYNLLESHELDFRVVPYNEVTRGTFISDTGIALVDVTGLAKPALFHSVRDALATNRHTFVCHTSAQSYYPLNEDIQVVLQASEERDYWVLLEEMNRVMTGDTGSYATVSLLDSDADESRRRMLCAFASPRHERLLTLLDRRQYDRIQLVAQNRLTPRGELARLSADFASKNYPATSVEELETNNLSGVLQFLTQTYHRWYVDNGFNFELGLTGSKLQAVACSAIAASFKVSQCWYVKPSSFELEKFTTGVGKTVVHKIEV